MNIILILDSLMNQLLSEVKLKLDWRGGNSLNGGERRKRGHRRAVVGLREKEEGRKERGGCMEGREDACLTE